MRALAFIALLALVCPVDAAPTERKAPTCKRTKWRYIDGEQVPWEHDEDDHEWDEFDHSEDECVPPPC